MSDLASPAEAGFAKAGAHCAVVLDSLARLNPSGLAAQRRNKAIAPYGSKLCAARK
jgi:hypothetical protein